MKKLQGCVYSTVPPFQESPTTILIACFTPITAAAHNQEALAPGQVKMDNQLDQASKHYTAISRMLYKNYLIHSVFNAVKTLALFLAFLTNLDNWNPTSGEQAPEKPTLCNFLENIIAKLTLRAEKTW